MCASPTNGIGWYLLRRMDTPWLSAVGWLLLGMLIERGFDQHQPLTLVAVTVLVVLAWFIAYSEKKMDEESVREAVARDV